MCQDMQGRSLACRHGMIQHGNQKQLHGICQCLLQIRAASTRKQRRDGSSCWHFRLVDTCLKRVPGWLVHSLATSHATAGTAAAAARGMHAVHVLDHKVAALNTHTAVSIRSEQHQAELPACTQQTPQTGPQSAPSPTTAPTHVPPSTCPRAPLQVPRLRV